ncbi:hypothetical protein [Pseudonocardia acaciae]|uniref:hypothetical protein n=1 Tax=Pseudonocardia acaciae TaxID=551276 RepID=UPI00048F49FF|nr:hypothetical protein [Pseudonocardia acaciae]
MTLFGWVRVVTVAVCAPAIVWLAWLVGRTVGRWAAQGRPFVAVPGVTVLVGMLVAVALLAWFGVAAGSASAGAARAARHGTRLTVIAGRVAVLFIGLVAVASGGVEALVTAGVLVVTLTSSGIVLHRASARLSRSGAADDLPYPTPLPASARTAHVDAVVDHGFRATAWGVLFIPALFLLVTALVWDGSVEDGLWVRHPFVASGLLGGGLLLVMIMIPAMVRHTRARNRHKALLAAYGIEVNDAGERLPPRRAR